MSDYQDCGHCRGNGCTYCDQTGQQEVIEYYEDEWYEDDNEGEYYYGEPDIEFAPAHLHTAHPRLFKLAARVDVWKPQPLWIRYYNNFKRGK